MEAKGYNFVVVVLLIVRQGRLETGRLSGHHRFVRWKDYRVAVCRY
jgi:hypothetical protein